MAACGGSSAGKPVAHVGDEKVTRAQLDGAVAHFREEAQVEGRSFPKKGSPAYDTVEREALGLLVYRTELIRSAAKLGVPVTEEEIKSRPPAASEEESDAGSFAHDSVESQIAYEHLYQVVTKDVPPARRGAAMRHWLRKMKADFKVSYEAGYGPHPAS